MNQPRETRSQIHVLVVDDSAFMRTALVRMIGSDSDLYVAGTAASGVEALEKISILDPDVVTLDVEMAGLNGLETLRCIMNQSPRPVLMVSSVTTKDAEITFDALGAGAFDYVPKQLSSASLDILHIREDLIAKIKAAAHARRFPPDRVARKPPRSEGSLDHEPYLVAPEIVTIGISTGGPMALQQILPLLPRDLAVPILIVQHMPSGFTAPFAQRLNHLCSAPVREATHREVIEPGVIYIAPAGRHLTVHRPSLSRSVILLAPTPENRPHIPSVDIMMESVAAAFHHLAMGVIMTGMGSDGAAGMRAIYREGGLTIGQDEASCVVYSMPRACAELGILRRVVGLPQIPQQILQATHYHKHA